MYTSKRARKTNSSKAETIPLNTILSYGRKEDVGSGESVVGGEQEKQGKQGHSCYADLNCCLPL